jgi:hypothetical protein
MGGGIPIERDLPGDPLLLDRSGNEALGPGDITVFAEETVNCLSRSINGTLQRDPFPFQLDVGLIDAPRGPY